ncbi:hypothetical protein GIB67_014058 [Kingdonia uniflora]|uniref:GTD-binding domain-containing protein n=1 Tax=Kingdonia uniflora TaxID=39325 RepID=A0A7J7KX98_9MAGN|nr:hypothetical protein GIB67_014058 [Kingdonia uniflora]
MSGMAPCSDTAVVVRSNNSVVLSSELAICLVILRRTLNPSSAVCTELVRVFMKLYQLESSVNITSSNLQWLLIFLLFIDALFSYLVTKFARYCELQTPCLLCSRLDNILGDEKPGFFKDLVCDAHKSEISPLVFCQIHNKLANVHGMCESCLVSFATEKKSNTETYRSLVGKLGTDLDSLIKHPKLGSSAERHCSCCNAPWASRLCIDELIQTIPVGLSVSKLDIPLQHSARDCELESHTDLKKRRKKLSEQRALSFGNNGFDSLSHVGCTELKISSDSESEFLYSDDDDAKVVVEETHVHNEVFVPHSIQPEISLLKLISDCLAPEMLIDQTCAPVPSFDIDKPHDTTSSNSSVWTVSVGHGHGLEELNWDQVDQKANFHEFPELISLHDDPSLSNFVEGLTEVSRESLNVSGSCDIDEAYRNKFGENFEPRNAVIPSMEPGLETIQVVGVSRETLDVVAGLDNGGTSVIQSDEVSNICEDLKLLFSQISSARGLDLSTKDTTLQVHGHGDESKTSDASSSGLDTLRRKISIERNESGIESLDGTHGSIVSALQLHGHGDKSKMSDDSSSSGLDTLQGKISIERNESGFESLDGSIVSEIEGEGMVDRLKRQVEHDRKSMSALYKELEEERNASAIAANEAMAMITRLQEEKASLHLEALQYLRMMEEQAEYDVEALQKANDLLFEREKDIQDLEAELEFYQNKLPDEPDMERPELVSDSDVSCIGNSTTAPTAQSPVKIENYIRILKDSSIDFEDEKYYISVFEDAGK